MVPFSSGHHSSAHAGTRPQAGARRRRGAGGELHLGVRSVPGMERHRPGQGAPATQISGCFALEGFGSPFWGRMFETNRIPVATQIENPVRPQKTQPAVSGLSPAKSKYQHPPATIFARDEPTWAQEICRTMTRPTRWWLSAASYLFLAQCHDPRRRLSLG